MEVCRAFYFLTVVHIRISIYQVVEGGGFEPPKLARQIYSLIPLATREPLLIYPKGQNPWLSNLGAAFYWNWEGCAIV